MDLSGLMESLHDNSNKLVIFKAYVPLLGFKATVLLGQLCTIADSCVQICTDEDGHVWYQQSIQWMARQTALSESGLRRAKQVLLDLGLIYVRQTASSDRTTLWRVNREKFSRLAAFAHALHYATNPDNSETIHIWIEFANKNPDIVEEFRPLYPRLNQYMSASAPIRRECPQPDLQTGNGPKLRDHVVFKKQKVEQTKCVRPSRFIEFWNTMPGVPKCKLGSKAYEYARRFFTAHQRYEAGNCPGFFLSTDEQERIHLEKINRIPVGVPLRGPHKRAIRPDEQIFRHIEQASLVYRKEYAPQNKAYLPKSLSAFLFNTFSKKHGIYSMFLEKIAMRPLLLEEVSVEAIMDNAQQDELDTLRVLKRLFDQANLRDEDQELSLRDLKTGLAAARRILQLYKEIPVLEVGIFAHHFGFYDQFLEWYERFAEDQLWEGMPMSAFHPSKDLWRRFVDFVSADIGYDLFTGERVS